MTIKHSKAELTLLDSLQLVPESLDNVLKSFKCKTQKNKFPYKAVNKKSLFYTGNKPAKKFYDNISDLDYLKIPDND